MAHALPSFWCSGHSTEKSLMPAMEIRSASRRPTGPLSMRFILPEWPPVVQTRANLANAALCPTLMALIFVIQMAIKSAPIASSRRQICSFNKRQPIVDNQNIALHHFHLEMEALSVFCIFPAPNERAQGFTRVNGRGKAHRNFA